MKKRDKSENITKIKGWLIKITTLNIKIHQLYKKMKGKRSHDIDKITQACCAKLNKKNKFRN